MKARSKPARHPVCTTVVEQSEPTCTRPRVSLSHTRRLLRSGVHAPIQRGFESRPRQGLVGITAGADCISMQYAFLVGGIAGAVYCAVAELRVK